MAQITHLTTRAECPAKYCAAQHTDDAGFVDPFQPLRAMAAIEKWNQGEYWETKDGDLLRIAEMGDSHLTNTIRFVRRNDTRAARMRRALSLPFPNFNGDMAQLCAESDWEREMERTMTDGYVGSILFAALARQHTIRLIRRRQHMQRLPKTADW